MTSEVEALRQIDAAFADARRPPDPEIAYSAGHDHDFELLYEYAHWHDVPDGVIERQDAALAFLGAAGFWHFLPAFRSDALRHPGSEGSAVESGVSALAPGGEDLCEFSVSTYADLHVAQRGAVRISLVALRERDDLGDLAFADALAYWRQLAGRGDA